MRHPLNKFFWKYIFLILYALAENRRKKNCEIDFASRFIALKSSLTKKEPLESILEHQRYRFVTIPPLLFNSTVSVLSYHSTCQKVGFKANKLAKCYKMSFYISKINLLSTTLGKTCWDKSSKFKKWINVSNSNSPPYPPISMLNLARFFWQKPKTLRTTLIFFWGEKGFSLKNRFSILSQQFCPRL